MGRAARVLVFCLPAALCAAWTVFAGKDLNWDLLNYHYYLPFELLAGRLQQDFFAASAQSYLNPVGYLPFFLMVSSGWHSVIASVTLAVAHSTSIALLYLIAWTLFAHLPSRQRIVFSSLASALGVATGVFWAMVGSSFLDPLLAPLILAGVLVLLTESGARRAALAGVLFGAAAALKYSNAVFVLAAFPLALVMPGLAGRSRWLAAGSYLVGAALAIGVLAGPWLALMQREFGNPVFPLTNAAGGRFMLQDLGAALAFPFRMIALDRHLYSETFAPDLRPAALLAAAVALPLVAALRRAPVALTGSDWRVLAFLCAAAVLWLATSANARYGLVVLLLAGVCLARIAERLLPLAAARVALALLLLVQLGTTVVASPTRWFLAEPWTRHWLAYDVPERAAARARPVPHAGDPADGGGRALRASRVLVRQLSRTAQPAARFAQARVAARAASRQGARARSWAGAGRGPAARRAGQRVRRHAGAHRLSGGRGRLLHDCLAARRR